jgi:alkylation response protein AidB-like acyl-CoA dehydrogenase
MSWNPSSSTSGFFQQLPIVPPQYTSQSGVEASHGGGGDAARADDEVFARILGLYLPANARHVTAHVHRVARLALHPSVLEHAVDAETNPPTLKLLTTYGEENKNDPLRTTGGWKYLKRLGYREGMIACAYDTQSTHWNRRVHEFALGHVFSTTGTMTWCPMAMQDGAATLLSRHLRDGDGDQPGVMNVFREAYRRLTSRDPEVAWTSGQWMTERTGGSDVSGTESQARRLSGAEVVADEEGGRGKDHVGMPLGPWRIDGFKWFSSATDSEMTVMLARTEKGLSAFFAPMRRRTGKVIPSVDSAAETMHATELNGVRISRLKNKMGTKAVPTAELELKGVRAWMIGKEGQGVKEISAILNITRLHTAAGSIANWARALAVSRAYTKVRKVRGGLLANNPQHLRWMADETIKYRAAAHLVFFGIALQGAYEQDWQNMVRGTKAEDLIPKDRTEVQHLLRLLTPVMKAQVTVASSHGVRECMESLGGVGYCENHEDGGLLNLAKIHRDNLVNPIWEGTVSVLAEDLVRVLLDKRLGNGDIITNVFVPWVQSVLRVCNGEFKLEIELVNERLQDLVSLVSTAGKDELLYRGRELLGHVEIVACTVLLLYDATADGDSIAGAVASRWARLKMKSLKEERDSGDWRKDLEIDRAIFLGDGVKSSRLEKL